MVQRQARERGTLEAPRRVGLMLETRADERLAALAAAAGTSRSAFVQWLIERVDLDGDGVPAGWAADHPREEALPLEGT